MKTALLVTAAFGVGYFYGRAQQSAAEARPRRSAVGNVARAMLSIHGAVDQNPQLYRRIAAQDRLSLPDTVNVVRTLT